MEHKGIILNCFGERSLCVEEVFHTSKSGRLRRGWAAAQPCQWDGHLAQSAVGIAVSRQVSGVCSLQVHLSQRPTQLAV